MSDKTKIEWADATVNAINGCSVVSRGCTNCYAMRLAGTRMKHHPSREGLTIEGKSGPVWNGSVRLHEPALLQPLRWRRPRTIFWNAHGDTFHPDVPDDWLFEMFEVIRRTPQHKHLVLTKRAGRGRAFIEGLTSLPRSINKYYGISEHRQLYQPLKNLWLGVSIEDQERANERVPDLLATPGVGRFLSIEPLLGPVDLSRIVDAGAEECFDADGTRGRLNALSGAYYVECREPDGTWEDCCGPDVIQRGFDEGARWKGNGRIHGVIVGGESGPGARPMHPDWVRSIRDDCATADVAFHFKQWGEYLPVFDRDVEDPDWRDCGRWERERPKGRWHNLAGGTGFHGDRVVYVDRVTKRMAGRTLDGAKHDALPWQGDYA